MTLHRFFVPPSAIGDDTVTLPEDASKQITKVLRLKPGDPVAVFDGSGAEWMATLQQVNRSLPVIAELTDKRVPASEPRVHVALCQALIKADRFEFILQKATELGIGSFRPLFARRTVPEQPSASKISRWTRIVREAAEQSGRVRVPEIKEPTQLEDACGDGSVPTLVLWEGETRRSFSEAATAVRPCLVNDGSTVDLVCGPEGGFHPEEIALLESRGAITAGLGPRTLRAETAAIVALTLALHKLGALDPSPRTPATGLM